MKFDKQDTNIAKTIAIIMMYIHHSFYSPESYSGYTFSFAPFGESRTVAIAQLFKVCVSVFVFLSAYGITISFMKKEKENCHVPLKEFFVDNFHRWIKLISGFIVIYILAQIFSFLGRNNTEVYGTGIKRVVYTVLDIFGLANIFNTPTFNSTWWYMGLALTVLLIMPLLYRAHKKTGVALFVLAVVLPRMLSLEFTSLRWCLPSICLGILFAERDLFVKLHNLYRDKIYLHVGKIIVAMAVLFALFIIRHKTQMMLDITDAFLSALIIYISFEIFGERGRVVKTTAAVCGKYSMNMFFAHTFFRGYYFKDFYIFLWECMVKHICFDDYDSFVLRLCRNA
ncbi:MAG: acyltransferase [Eubacterium sp.]|nr:acyltransferase [Eubacterium sp.]